MSRNALPGTPFLATFPPLFPRLYTIPPFLSSGLAKQSKLPIDLGNVWMSARIYHNL